MKSNKKKKNRNTTPLSINPKASILGFIGGFTVILILLLLTRVTHNLWIMAPFGASCVLAFGVWDSPLSQPRNIVGGHMLSTCVGLLCKNFLGDSMLVTALAVGLAIMTMMLTKTTHPPAGADPLVVLLTKQITGWSYLITPVLVGSLVVVLCAMFVNNVPKERNYPTFWI